MKVKITKAKTTKINFKENEGRRISLTEREDKGGEDYDEHKRRGDNESGC